MESPGSYGSAEPACECASALIFSVYIRSVDVGGQGLFGRVF